ncbi:DEAD-domain-containing protein [Wolfiporia cocos MD-104 SS10]|uniref:ATP-dependent RNA helicase n=1 Tax=Wolfiporia cocos (strain MD-104) TaxID=742152 RepID=A0A2H3JRR9_WOLCO|nr:DEAD-domain-containing protein [Wolfiporia cocos MD-104 SS10]
MAVSLWARAARASGLSIAILARAPRCAQPARHSAILAAQVTARRWASTATAAQEEPEQSSELVEQSVEEQPAEFAENPSTPKAPKAKPPVPNADQPEFSTLKGSISYDTLKAITVRPFQLKHMTSVQAAVLPLLPAIAEPYDPEAAAESGTAPPPRDLLVRAKTGTGKTLAFLVPAVEARLKAVEASGKQAVKDAGLVSDKHLEGRARRIFARAEAGCLIISPTRELAQQIANEAIKLTDHHADFQVQLFVGGSSKRIQLRDWMKNRRDIVVGTPGRIRDLLENEPEVAKGLAKAKMLILDEADTLLDMGFRDDITAITDFLPPTPERQTFMFSATVSTQIKQIARATLDKNHLFINCVSDSAPPTHAHVPQYHTVLPNAASQIPHLLRLLAHDQLLNAGKSKTIVFLPTTKLTQLFATMLRSLSRSSLPAGSETKVYEIHSKRMQHQRDSASNSFRSDRSGASILVTSDVSARGVDYPGVTRVIQVGIPSGTDHYIHRVGRTGRGSDTSGRADLVLLPWEVGFLTWQLTDIPLKPLTTNELTNQVTELAREFDKNPPKAQRTAYQQPYTPLLEGMQEQISSLLERLDEDAIKETMASMLGYYMGRTGDIRVQKSVMLQGCRDWTVEACGLPTPPYISESFLLKLGVNDGRTKHFGKAMRQKEYVQEGPRWAGRGSQRAKDERMRTARSAESFSRGMNNEDNFRSARFNSRPRKSFGMSDD